MVDELTFLRVLPKHVTRPPLPDPVPTLSTKVGTISSQFVTNWTDSGVSPRPERNVHRLPGRSGSSQCDPWVVVEPQD